MQEDMHYYGTYAMARAAGLSIDKARVIACAAQYVDDSTVNDSEVHEDGGMFETVATAHTNAEAVGNAIADHTEQRKVWVPFHFFPGNEGGTLSEKLLCVKDSQLAQEMVANNIRHAIRVKDEYGLLLIGITAHVYADTFSHYGFSGVSSRYNRVDGESFELDVVNPEVKAYIMGKLSGFLTKYSPSFLIKNYCNFVSQGVELATGALGHGAVGTYPDRPFLRWKFRYTHKEEQRPTDWRDNKKTFLEACEKLHTAFSAFADGAEFTQNAVAFESIKDKVKTIIEFEGAKEERIDQWKEAILSGALFSNQPGEALSYSPEEWEQQKDGFQDLNRSVEILDTEVYHYHQAAMYHRNYVLKQLLPKHGILVL